MVKMYEQLEHPFPYEDEDRKPPRYVQLRDVRTKEIWAVAEVPHDHFPVWPMGMHCGIEAISKTEYETGIAFGWRRANTLPNSTRRTIPKLRVDFG